MKHVQLHIVIWPLASLLRRNGEDIDTKLQYNSNGRQAFNVNSYLLLWVILSAECLTLFDVQYPSGRDKIQSRNNPG